MICSLCSTSVDSKSFVRHVRYSHKYHANGVYPCHRTCKKTFKSFDSFRKHFREKHANVTEEYAKVIDNMTAEQDTVLDNDVQLEIDESGATEETVEELNLDAKNEVQTQSEMCLRFAAKLYNYADLPRNRASSIIQDVDKLFQSTFSKSNCFENVLSEKKALRTFKELETYINPETIFIGERKEYVKKDGVKFLKMVPIKAEFIPLRKVLKVFFEIPNILDDTLKYMDCLKEDKAFISNFIQASLWQEIKARYGEKIVFPLVLFFDDYEVNNPIGSHRGLSKCGAVYVSIPCLPPSMQSQLQNIFLFILFNTLDRKLLSNKLVFQRAIDEMRILENSGINVKYNNQEIQIYFALSLVVGDNLGMHQILGFSESFNANIFCRFCKTKKSDICKILSEEMCNIRTRESYEKDLVINDSKQTGIVEKCIFHAINFDVTKNLAVDVMHDVLEGILQYDFGLILHRYIKVDKYLTLTELNTLIKGFDYGTSKNVPTEILEDQLNKKRLVMSASEMLCFTRNIILIIGHLIPKNDLVWDLIKQIVNFVNIITSNVFYLEDADLLEIKIHDYLNTRNSIFPACLKPKHHYLIHYPRIRSMVGPLWKICCMRYESKNRESKITSRVSVSRVNVCHTLAIKHQLRFNYRLLEKSICAETSVNKSTQNIYSQDLPGYPETYNLLPNNIQSDSVIKTTKEVLLNGQVIYKKSIIAMEEEDGFLFYEIETIIINCENELIFLVKLLSDVSLDEHTGLYEIDSFDFKWTILMNLDVHTCFVTRTVKTCNGKFFIFKNWQ